MQENFRVEGKKLFFGFVDLEKAFDRVPREVISWAMHKLGIEEWLVSAAMSIYPDAKTCLRIAQLITCLGTLSKAFSKSSNLIPL